MHPPMLAEHLTLGHSRDSHAVRVAAQEPSAHCARACDFQADPNNADSMHSAEPDSCYRSPSTLPSFPSPCELTAVSMFDRLGAKSRGLN